MNGLSFSKGQFLSYVSAVLISVFFVAMATFGASTISTNISTDGTLAVSGAATFSGAVYASSTLGVTGVANFYGNVAFSNYATSTASTGQIASQGGLSASGTVAVGGVATFYGNVVNNGFATTTASNGNFTTLGHVTATGTAAFGGVVTSYGNLLVNGFATTTAASGNFASQGNINILGSLSATGSVAFGQGNKADSLFAYATATVSRTASTSVSQEFNVVGDVFVGRANGTTTLYLDTAGASQGSCIQMRGATSSVVFRMYISESTGASGTPVHLLVERGACQ